MVSLELQPGFYNGCEGHGWHKAIGVLQGISMDDMRNKYCFSILFWQWSMGSFFCDMDTPAAKTNMDCTCWLLRDTQLLLLIFGSEKVQTAWLFFVI